MKHLLAILPIGISCLLFACGGKEISPPQETASQLPETAETHSNLELDLKDKDKKAVKPSLEILKLFIGES